MSGIKKWIAAILMTVAFAGYLTLSDGGREGCLTTYLLPDVNPPAQVLAGMIGMPPGQMGGARWGHDKGGPIIFLFDTRGRGVSADVCFTGDVMNPDTTIVGVEAE